MDYIRYQLNDQNISCQTFSSSKRTNHNTDNKGKLFVMLFAWLWATYRDQYLTRHPDTHSCSQLKSCILTNFCLRDNLHRDTAPVTFLSFIYRDYSPIVYQTCTTIAPALNKIRTWMAKSTPYLACTGTVICLKYQDPTRILHQVTQPPFIAGPLYVRCSIPDY